MNQLKDNPYLKKIIHFKTITNLLFKNCDINGIYYYIYQTKKKFWNPCPIWLAYHASILIESRKKIQSDSLRMIQTYTTRISHSKMKYSCHERQE